MEEQERKEVLNQVLRPSVRIVANQALGSGTIVYSKDGDTFLFTNHHVIAKNIRYDEVWDEVIRKDVKKDFLSQVEVQVGRFNDIGERVASTSLNADIVAYNKEKDMALLKIRDKENYVTATLFPKDKAKNIPSLVDLCCCGCALGEKPVVTFGNLNGIQIEIDNLDYWLSSAPSIFGNSGGGLYTKYDGKMWRFVGIPSRIPVLQIGFGGSAIAHMGYFIPVYRIYKWLDEICYGFIYDDKLTPEDCEKMREKKKDRELAGYLRRKG